MASKIPVELLIGVTITLLIVSVFLLQGDKTEGFQTQGYTTKDLDIQTCPANSKEIQTAKGLTICCTGDNVDGKCSGKNICAKSPNEEGIPVCIEYWRTYFSEKGIQLCPANMPNYFEDVTNAQAEKGCSASGIQQEGKAPQNAAMRRCRIYNTEAENRSKADSCYLERERLKIQCPVVNGKSPEATAQVDKATNTFNYFFCSYPVEPDNTPAQCNDEKTIKAYYDRTRPNWRTTSPIEVEDALCKNYIVRRQKYKEEQRRLAEERRRREAAEANARRFRSLFDRFRNLFNRGRQDNSRLQQQLDDANRNCRR